MGRLSGNQGLWDGQSEGVHGYLALNRLDRVNRNGNCMGHQLFEELLSVDIDT